MSKVIVITGGSSGVGYFMTKLLLAQGYKVFILSRNSQESDLVDSENCIGVNVDIRKISDIKKAKEIVQKKLQNIKLIHALINCAGIGYEKKLEEVTEDDYENIFSTNVKGLIFTTKIFLPIIDYNGGVICNISSIAGIKGFANWSVYSSSKFAVEGFTTCIRHELRNKGIKVSSIRLGSVDTPLYKQIDRNKKKYFINPHDAAKLILESIFTDSKICVEDIFINNSVGDI